MATPVITPVVSVENYGVGVYFDFELSASGSPTSWAITGLRNGVDYDSTTGVISGTPTKACHLAVKAVATNGDGAGAAIEFVIIIPAGNDELGSAIKLTYDLESAAVTSSQPALPVTGTKPAPILYGKTKSKLLIAVGFARDGALVPVDISGLHLAIKELVPEPLLNLTAGTFKPIWTVDGPRYVIVVDLTDPIWASVESNYEDDIETFFDARSELVPTFLEVELTDESPSEHPRGSQTFGFRIALSLK